ncbi:hypothetical protein PFDG_05367, partial [Plasmodium falciparum Dd2]
SPSARLPPLHNNDSHNTNNNNNSHSNSHGYHKDNNFKDIKNINHLNNINTPIVGNSLRHTLHDNFFNFLTDLHIKYFINHLVTIKTIGTYQHFSNLYYMHNKKLVFSYV